MRHLRRAPVAVLVGDGLNAAAPRHSDVAVEEAEVNAHHRHPAYRSGSGDSVRCGSPLRALRLLREGKERTHSLSENLGQGVGIAEVEPLACAAPPPPGPPLSLHCGSPPPTGSYCGLRLRSRPREARATGRLRLGGLALGRSRQRSATARCRMAGSRKSWKEGGGREAAGQGGAAVARREGR